MVEVPKAARDLFAHYKAHHEEFQGYKEANIRDELIDKFFGCLGWDVTNELQVPPAQRSVVIEPSMDDEDSKRAPDYIFIQGKFERFYVEAKKTSIMIKRNSEAAYQIRRYGWTGKLPVCILTNFESFAVYDCRFPPHPNDPAEKGRLAYFTHEQVPELWEYFSGLFSKDAVRNGRLDEYAEKVKAKRGTLEVDEAFLVEIDRWRELIAKSFAKLNRLTAEQLNSAVQMTIDRLIFLRICEDREIEPYKQLAKAIRSEHAYRKLFELFRHADDRYNSGLFHFTREAPEDNSADELTPDLKLEDKVLEGILGRLYYPESPYAFRILPIETLGQVYEQFLGRVIRLTEQGRVKIEEKPEVTKAGGVVYTPAYIVEAIIEDTLGKYLAEKKSPGDISDLRIIDPACGSGTFLIRAYTHLLDWHLDCYASTNPQQAAEDGRIEEGDRDQYRLTSKEKKRILRAHIFGIDIDPQAVEVTKLSLLLKVIEGESSLTIRNERKFNLERALPDLGRNIRCGNSLIDQDVFETRPELLSNQVASRRINAFDWATTFPEVFQRPDPGFDVIIGNPPYVDIQTMNEWIPDEVEYYKERYLSTKVGNYDIYVAFVERSLSKLRTSGLMGFIVPHKFFTSEYGEPMRTLLSSGRHVSRIVHFGFQKVFPKRSIYTCLLFLRNRESASFEFTKVENLRSWRLQGAGDHGTVEAARLGSEEWNIVVGPLGELFYRMQSSPAKLSSAGHLFVGLQTSADTVFVFEKYGPSRGGKRRVFSQALDKDVWIESALLKRVLRSGSVGRYWATPTAYVLFPYRREKGKFELMAAAELEGSYRSAWEYLLENRKLLAGRENGKFKGTNWYAFGRHQNLNSWEQAKIMIPYMVPRLSAFHDRKGEMYFVNVTTGGYGMTIDGAGFNAKLITGLINSKLLNWFMTNLGSDFQGGYMGTNKQFLVQLPLPPTNPDAEELMAAKSKVEALVDLLHELHEEARLEVVDHLKEKIQMRIETADRMIDEAVYKLYGLEPAEAQLVESRPADRRPVSV